MNYFCSKCECGPCNRNIDVTKFPDTETAEQGCVNFYRHDKYEYLGFSQFIQGAFLSKGSWLIDTGNFSDLNGALIPKIAEKIQKHPLIWKWFFKVR